MIPGFSLRFKLEGRAIGPGSGGLKPHGEHEATLWFLQKQAFGRTSEQPMGAAF